MSAPAKHMLRSAAETVALLAPLVALLTCAYLQIEQSGLLTLLVGCAALAVFFCGFETGKPALRQIMPTATLGALAAAGRILFAPIPDFKPVSAICIIAGTVFGKHSGFMVGLGAHGPSLGTVVLLCYGFLSGLGYGFILNSWYIVAFLVPVTWQGALAAYLAGMPLDLIHSIATAIFLSALYLPWKRKLERIKRKYALR